MNFFHELGLTILGRWQGADFDARAFPEIACAALRERPPSAHVDPMDVIRWVHETPVLVPQADITIEFGQPPITVFRCEHFYIDVLFWVDGTTAIHQHRFSGAFHVMDGASLQSTYRFHQEHRYSEQLLAGRLELTDVELLVRGDVRPIEAGMPLIHALFHLDRPSVSVVVRTPADAFAGTQYSYLRTGLAFDPFDESESMRRKIQTLDLLFKLNSKDFEPLARASIARADSFRAFQLLRHLQKRLEPHEKYLAFLESVRPAHEPLISRLKAWAEDERRDRHIITRRQIAKEREHRFFLALLLNLPDRRRILEMVRSAFPDRPPVDTVIRWLEELAKLDAVNAWVLEVANVRTNERSASANILDVLLDPVAIQVARHMLEQAPADTGFEPWRAADPSDSARQQEGDAKARWASLRASLLLRPLFVT